MSAHDKSFSASAQEVEGTPDLGNSIDRRKLGNRNRACPRSPRLEPPPQNESHREGPGREADRLLSRVIAHMVDDLTRPVLEIRGGGRRRHRPRKRIASDIDHETPPIDEQRPDFGEGRRSDFLLERDQYHAIFVPDPSSSPESEIFSLGPP